MFRKTIVRILILALFLASALIVTISTQVEALHISALSLSTDTSIGKIWFGLGSKTKAKAKVTWLHAKTADSLFGEHFHRFTYSLHARVADETDYNPPLLENGDHEYGNVSVSSWTRFYAPKSKYASVTAHERWENDAYASASASETGNPDNWDFN